MLQKVTVTAALVLACVASAYAQQQTQPATKGSTANTPSQGTTLTAADRNFITKAAADGHKEIELAQLAQQKAATPTAKELAARILKDHQQADQELKALAQSKGVTLPAPPDHKAVVAKFEKVEGAAFDRTYSNMMVQDHTAAIALFERASKSKDAEVSAFAEKTLPALREHLRMSKEAQGATTSTSGTKPATTKPGAMKPETTTPGIAKPDTAKPDTTKPATKY
jgi:putative membrane protein